jgi:hypothetical protein
LAFAAADRFAVAFARQVAVGAVFVIALVVKLVQARRKQAAQ